MTRRPPEGIFDERGMVAIWAVPKASASRIEGWVQDAAGKRWLKVRIAAAPEDGKANKALIKFLAKQWSVPASSLTLVSGEASRYKTIKWNSRS